MTLLNQIRDAHRNLDRHRAYRKLQDANKAFETARANKAAALKAYFATAGEA